ncbi:MAG: hypothetical protein CM1200mP41_10960 [Gammaproteobacteria bacterium]|nr:MAG: hypothetical protein CM1200mP41_10960 [Gammaproteobacteria bacterium]
MRRRGDGPRTHTNGGVSEDPFGDGVLWQRGVIPDANKAVSIENRFYGVYDDGSKLGLTEANLREQQRTYSTATARVYKNDLGGGLYPKCWQFPKRGWYITLPDEGERVIDRALVKGNWCTSIRLFPGNPDL